MLILLMLLDTPCYCAHYCGRTGLVWPLVPCHDSTWTHLNWNFKWILTRISHLCPVVHSPCCVRTEMCHAEETVSPSVLVPVAAVIKVSSLGLEVWITISRVERRGGRRGLFHFTFVTLEIKFDITDHRWLAVQPAPIWNIISNIRYCLYTSKPVYQ